ncbi:hypothetical protein ACFL1R_04310 [Candidatus Latescibacterota bacterium]
MLAISFAEGVCEEENKSYNGLNSFIVPVFIYSTDTGFGGGVTGFKSYNTSRPRISYVQSSFVYTVKKQLTTAFQWNHYLSRKTDRISFGVKYSRFPTYFFGMGNNTDNKDTEKYTPEYISLRIFYERTFEWDFKVKTHFFLHNQSLIKYKNGGILKSTAVPWHGGRLDAGMGLSVLRDSRENVIATRRGTLAQLEYRAFMIQDKGGAFSTLSLDVRTFINPYPDVVLGYMIWCEDSRGDVPFYMLSKLGGNDRLRGCELNRFRDRSIMLVQHDIRYPIWGPVGGALFIATGRVAGDIPSLFSGTFHTAYGAGLRFYFNREDNLVLRCDYAKGRDSKGFYIAFGEAF